MNNRGLHLKKLSFQICKPMRILMIQYKVDEVSSKGRLFIDSDFNTFSLVAKINFWLADTTPSYLMMANVSYLILSSF